MENLPEHAQEIYRKSFNHAWETYADPGKRNNPDDTQESVAHKVAWSAVEKTYKKRDGRWVPETES
jgi:cation transport regulator